MKSDAELLRSYHDEKSEVAFTALVQRHLNLVYSVALRRVGGDTHLAEDVTQRVFADLARKASNLTGHSTLTGWLYVSANVASAAVVRSEQRRKVRETEAHTMQNLTSSSADEADWARLRPAIDDAIVELGKEDREAVVLRFFGQRSFGEVGAAIHVSEEAARKRVDRALEKLRSILARRGVTSTVAALGLALTAVGSGIAPAALTAKVATHAMAQGAASAGGSIAGTLTSVLLPTAAALVVGGLLISAQQRTNDELRRELAQATQGNQAIAALRTENAGLAREVAVAEESRRRQAATVPSAPIPIASPAPGPRAVSAQVSVSSRGTIAWEGKPVNLREFITLMQTLRQTADPESQIVIQGNSTTFSALAYVIDEIRKAEFNHVTVESDATPDPKLGFSWFRPMP